MDIVHGFCFLVRRTAYTNVGGLDLDAFPMGYGEIQDLSLRLQSAGFRIGICPSVFVEHGGTRSFSRMEKSELSKSARVTLYEKHGTKTYLEAETKCLLNPDLAFIRSALYGWFDVTQQSRHDFIPASINVASLRRIEEAWRSRRKGFSKTSACVKIPFCADFTTINVSHDRVILRQSQRTKSNISPTGTMFSSTLARRRLEAFTVFDSSHYLAKNPDVKSSGMNAASHLLEFGFREKARTAFEKVAVAREMGKIDSRMPYVPTLERQLPHINSLELGVYCSSHGNQFISEIASLLTEELQGLNLQVALLNETASVDRRPDLCIFVAPHEFFYNRGGEKWNDYNIISKSIMLNTEQIQESWFAMAAPYLFNSAGVVDICFQNSEIFANAGVPSVFWMPKLKKVSEQWVEAKNINHPLSETLPDVKRARPSISIQERPLDITFFGAPTPYRETFFCKAASTLAKYNNLIYLRRASGPLNASRSGNDLLELTKFATMMSKISLNIHRDEVGYFEWHRIVDIGASNGAVVVSEKCFKHPIIKEGKHYQSESIRFLPELLEWLIEDKEGQSVLVDTRANFEELTSSANASRLSIELVGFIFDIQLRTDAK